MELMSTTADPLPTTSTISFKNSSCSFLIFQGASTRVFVIVPKRTPVGRNKFVISGGSYGGIYVPNIATVIHEQNLLLKSGGGQPGAIPVDLDALIISNPFTVSDYMFSESIQFIELLRVRSRTSGGFCSTAA